MPRPVTPGTTLPSESAAYATAAPSLPSPSFICQSGRDSAKNEAYPPAIPRYDEKVLESYRTHAQRPM